jgi:DNA-binding transcriptional ArsR family regulator
MTDHTASPDYDLAEVLELTRSDQFQALGGVTRPKILGLLGQHAATTAQIAATLALPKGTVGHHLKVLEAAGLIRVVRTRPVRALTEKYYGRVARAHRLATGDGAPGEALRPAARAAQAQLLRQASAELLSPAEGDDPTTCLLVHAHVTPAEARSFAKRLEALAQEFSARVPAGERVYGLVAGVYLTDWPDLAGQGLGAQPAAATAGHSIPNRSTRHEGEE